MQERQSIDIAAVKVVSRGPAGQSSMKLSSGQVALDHVLFTG